MTSNQGNVAMYVLIALIIGVLAGGAAVWWLYPQPPVPSGTLSTITPEPVTAAAVTASPTPLPTINPALSRTYAGTLPCADCEGIATELTLTQSSPFAAEGTFVLKENYLGQKDGLVQSSGLWTTLRGTPKDINAIVFQLNPNKLSDARYYLKVSDIAIKLLDKNQQEIDSKLNYSLILQAPSPSPSASPSVSPSPTT